MKQQYIVEAVLTATDNGYSATLQKAQTALEKLGSKLPQTSSELDQSAQGMGRAAKETKSFKDTMLGMASAIGITTAISKGFGLIKSSIGAALGRLDTFDQFNRLMTEMTGSTEHANLALDRTNAIVKGTAYGLDTAAKSVQDFVTRGMSIDSAIGTLEAWGDAVAFYGQGTNEQLATVSDALGKMITKGRVGMDQLNRLFDVGIDAVGIYAKATGQSADDVQEALSKGTITSQEFVTTVTKAMMEGTNGVTKIAGAAKKAGSSWSGTFANMRAAVARGVGAIITNIEDGRKKADLPTMKDTVANFGKSAEKVLKGVGKVAGFTAEHFEDLVKVVGVLAGAKGIWSLGKSITSTYEAFKKNNAAIQETVKQTQIMIGLNTKGVAIEQIYDRAMSVRQTREAMIAAGKKLNIDLTQKDLALSTAQQAAILAETGALSGKAIVQGVLAGKIGLTTAAQYAWNAAMAANPIGMIVTLIGGFALAVKGLTSLLNKKSEEDQKIIDNAKSQVETNQQLIDSTQELSASYEASVISTDKNADGAKRMVDELVAVQNSTMDATDKQIKMRSAVERLNMLYPDLKVELDETGTAIKGTTDQLYKQVEAMRDAGKTKAYEDALQGVWQKQVDLETQIKETERSMKEMVDSDQAYATIFDHNTQEFYTLRTKEFEELENSHKDLQDQLDGLTKKEQELSEQLKVTTEAQLKKNQEAREAAKLANMQAEEIAQVKEHYGLTTDAIVEYSKRTGATWEEIGESLTEFAQKFGLTNDELMIAVEESGLTFDEWGKQYKEYTDKLEKYSEKFGFSAEAMEEAAARQGVTLDEWAAAYEDYLKTYEDAVNRHVQVTVDGFNEIEQQTAVSLDKYIEILNKNAAATENWSTNIEALMAAGVDQGVIAQLEKLGPAGATQAQAFVEELTALNGGVDISLGATTDAAKAKLEELSAAMGNGMDKAYEAAQTSLNVHDYQGLGVEIPQETAEGIESSGHLVEKGSAELAKKGSAAFSAESDCQSSTYAAAAEKNAKAYSDSLGSNISNVDFSGVKQNVSSAFQEIDDCAARSSQETVQKIGDNFSKLPGIAEEKLGQTKSQVETKLGEIDSTAGSKIAAIKTKFDRGFALITVGVTRNMSIATVAFSNQVNLMADKASQGSAHISRSLMNGMSGLPGQMANTGHNAGIGFYNGLAGTAGSIYNLANSIANNVAATINRALQVRSPSRVLMYSGEMVGAGLEVGMLHKLKDIKAAASDLSLAAVPDVQKMSSFGGEIDYKLSGLSASKKADQPLSLTLKLGGKSFRAFAKSIGAANDHELELREAYSV